MRTKKLVLSYGWTVIPKQPYRVEQVENSTARKPGEFLSERDVDDYCASAAKWSVIVKAKPKA
jgi:hypothetical protein